VCDPRGTVFVFLFEAVGLEGKGRARIILFVSGGRGERGEEDNGETKTKTKREKKTSLNLLCLHQLSPSSRPGAWRRGQSASSRR
jgi:hypothetical protein